MQAGVETTAVRVLATIHDFVMLNPLAGTAATKAAIELAAQKLARTFGSAAERPAA
jgi:acetyl esterase